MKLPLRFLPLLTGLSLPAFAQAQPAPPADLGTGVVQMVLGLAVVLALILGSLWLLKRVTGGQGAPGRLLRVVAGTAVGPRERVVVVEVDDTWLVLGVAPGRVNALHSLPRRELGAADALSSPVVAAGFADRLKRVLEKNHAPRA